MHYIPPTVVGRPELVLCAQKIATVSDIVMLANDEFPIEGHLWTFTSGSVKHCDHYPAHRKHFHLVAEKVGD